MNAISTKRQNSHPESKVAVVDPMPTLGSAVQTEPPLLLLSERIRWAMDAKEKRDGRRYLWSDLPVAGGTLSSWLYQGAGISPASAAHLAAYFEVDRLWLQTGVKAGPIQEALPAIPAQSDRLYWAKSRKEKLDGRAYTWAELACAAKIPRPSISRCASGKSQLPPTQALQLGSFLCISAEWLRNGVPEEKSDLEGLQCSSAINPTPAAGTNRESHAEKTGSGRSIPPARISTVLLENYAPCPGLPHVRDRLVWAKAEKERKDGREYQWTDILSEAGIPVRTLRLNGPHASQLAGVLGVTTIWLQIGENDPTLDVADDKLTTLWDRILYGRASKEKRDGRLCPWSEVFMATGIAPGTLSIWRHPEAKIAPKSAKKLAAFFGVDQLWLQKGDQRPEIADCKTLKTLGERLEWAKEQKERRDGSALTWAEISRRSRVSSPDLSQFLSGRRPVSKIKATKLGTFFGVDPDWVRTGGLAKQLNVNTEVQC